MRATPRPRHSLCQCLGERRSPKPSRLPRGLVSGAPAVRGRRRARGAPGRPLAPAPPLRSGAAPLPQRAYGTFQTPSVGHSRRFRTLLEWRRQGHRGGPRRRAISPGARLLRPELLKGPFRRTATLAIRGLRPTFTGWCDLRWLGRRERRRKSRSCAWRANSRCSACLTVGTRPWKRLPAPRTRPWLLTARPDRRTKLRARFGDSWHCRRGGHRNSKPCGTRGDVGSSRIVAKAQRITGS